MKRNHFVLLIIILCLGSLVFWSFRTTKTINNNQLQLTENKKYQGLAEEYAGEQITSTDTLTLLLKIDNDTNPYNDTKSVKAYRYNDLIYASFTTGESGWYKIFHKEQNGGYRVLAGGQDVPMCKSFTGYQVSKGLWCRTGGCFDEKYTSPINVFDDCLK